MTEYLMSRPAQLQACTRCGSHVLVAIDQGTTVTTDIHALDIHAEIAALLCGKPTYEIWRESRSKAYIHWRNIFMIRNGSRDNAIVASHVCPDGCRPHGMTWHIPGNAAVKAEPVRVIHDTEFPF